MRIKGFGAVKNLGRVYFAQSISFCLTIIMTLYTPKFLGVTQFSYWQLFLLYTSYVGLIQFGLNDGIYLRYGGKILTQENKSILSGQFLVLVSFLITTFLSIAILFFIFSDNQTLKYLCLLVCTYGIFSNINGYLVYLLQSTNRIKLYARVVIIDKLFLIVAILFIGFSQCKDYKLVAIIYILGVIIADFIMITQSDKSVTSQFKINNSVYIEILENIRAGFPLMLSGIASSLIVGICRYIISDYYPIETFGMVSLSFTLTVFVLGFISQVGMVVYPLLKNKNINFHRMFYYRIDFLIIRIIPYSFIILPVITLVITSYLPKYIGTIPYLSAIFPLCLFETQNSILLNTYMKVLRKERKLLFINVISFVVSLCSCLIAVYVFDSVIMALICVTAIIILKSELMRKYISMDLGNDNSFNINIVLTILYYILIILRIPILINLSILIAINSIFILKYRKKFFEAIVLFINR